MPFNFFSATNAPNGSSDAINTPMHHWVDSVFCSQTSPNTRQNTRVNSPCPMPKTMLTLWMPMPYFKGMPMKIKSKNEMPSMSEINRNWWMLIFFIIELYRRLNYVPSFLVMNNIECEVAVLKMTAILVQLIGSRSNFLLLIQISRGQ